MGNETKKENTTSYAVKHFVVQTSLASEVERCLNEGYEFITSTTSMNEALYLLVKKEKVEIVE